MVTFSEEVIVIDHKLAFAFLTLSLTFLGPSTAAVSLAKPSSAASIKKLAFERPSSTTTCIEIRAQYPNGVASSKQIKKKYSSKAIVNRNFYYTNFHFDTNGNQIICDPRDRIVSPPEIVINEIINGVSVRLFVDCDLLDAKIEYGTTVGYATLFLDYRCRASLVNDDPIYSLARFAVDDIKTYVVWNLLSNENGVPQWWYMGLSQLDGYNFLELKSNSIQTIEDQRTNRIGIDGTKGEIENLYLRIINGLLPDFHVEVELASKESQRYLSINRRQCHYAAHLLDRNSPQENKMLKETFFDQEGYYLGCERFFGQSSR